MEFLLALALLIGESPPEPEAAAEPAAEAEPPAEGSEPTQPETNQPIFAEAQKKENRPPTTRRLVVPVSRGGKLSTKAYFGEGIVDVFVRPPVPESVRALYDQVGEVIVRVEVFENDIDLLHARLHTSVLYREATIKKGQTASQAVIDLTLYPQALTPKEPLEPPVMMLDLSATRLPLPTRTTKPKHPIGDDINDRLDDSRFANVRSLVVRARQQGESEAFLDEVLLELAVRKPVDVDEEPPTLPAFPTTPTGQLLWVAAALTQLKITEVEDKIRELKRTVPPSGRSYVALYDAELQSHLRTAPLSPSTYTRLVAAGKSLPDRFSMRTALRGATAHLRSGNITAALEIVSADASPEALLWQAELLYLQGRRKAAIAMFNRALADRRTKPLAQIRLIDLGTLNDEAAEERILNHLNLRPNADTAARLARARLLERGVLTKSFRSTLDSLSHLAGSPQRGVAVDAEFRIGRLMGTSGRPAEALRSYLRAETQAQSKTTRDIARQRSHAAFHSAVEQLSRWGRSQALIEFVTEFDELMRIHPRRAELIPLIATAARKAGETTLAIKHLIAVASGESGRVQERILAELIETYLQAGDMPRARTVLSYASEAQTGEGSAELHRAHADTARQEGDLRSAFKYFMAAARTSPSGAFRTENLAIAAEVAFERKKYIDAKAALERLLYKERPDPQHANQARIDLASIHLMEDNPAQALQLLEEVKKDPDVDQLNQETLACAAYFEGEANWAAGHRDKAIAIWKSRNESNESWDTLSRAALRAAGEAQMPNGER